MSTQNNGGPAFPYSGVHKGEKVNLIVDSHGMTLRDYFAIKCMATIIGSLNGPVTGEELPGDFDYYSACAYSMADAMLRVREAS